MLDTPAFAALLSRVRRRDQAASTQLMTLWKPFVIKTIRSRLIHLGLKAIDAEDVAQTVFANLFSKLAEGKYDLPDADSLSKLLNRSARNQVLDEMRRIHAARRGSGKTQTPQPDDFLAGIPNRDETPSRIVSNEEIISEMHRRLTDEEKRIAAERSNGRDWAEIASMLGGSPEALRKKLARAYDRIRRELDIDYLPPV